MKATKFKPTRTEQRARRAAAAAAVRAFKSAKYRDPMKRFAAGMAVLLRESFKPVSRRSTQQNTKGQIT
ncbi:MAG TPA: hypothetical protein VNT99_11520 [Methylomirabilota bacterium]|nr:hypothetical protein [Methylomirabilota bacterium]